MATRWTSQRNEFGCGPVAIINLLKWLGDPATYERDYPTWRRKCCCTEYGTPLKNFVRALYSIKNIKITPRNVPNIGVISEALESGRAVVMKSAYYEGDDLMGHYFLVTNQTEKSFYCVNLNKRHGWVPKAAFSYHWLQLHINYCHECGIAPYSWMVRKT
jgi:hypothetical protein